MYTGEAKTIEATEPLSKALDEIMASGTAVFVTKDRRLFGLIDDRNMRLGISDASKTKCGNACVKCPSLNEGAEVQERIRSFLAGHFKSLPVLDAKGRIMGALTRADLLRELVSLKLVPKAQAYQHMSRPAVTIDENQTVAGAKSTMKKNDVHHLVVTRSGTVVGSISTLDLAGFLTKPKGRQSYQLISEVQGLESRRIVDILRGNFVSVEETTTLEEAALKMAEENVSNLVIVADKKPVGVLSATDIFKIVVRLYEKENEISISGLDESTLVYYGKIKNELLGIAAKFGKALKIENLAVRIKKGKSVYEADMHLDLNNKHKAFRCEGYNLSETTAALSYELKTLFEKVKSEKKERRKSTREVEE